MLILKENNKKQLKEPIIEASVIANNGNPETAEEMVNFYGTYQIQPTADTDNQYPAIAQGYNNKIKRRDGENKHHGRKFEKDEGDKF